MASSIPLVKSKKWFSQFFSTFTEISPAVALSEDKVFTNFLTVASETHWKRNFLYKLNLSLILIILGWLEKLLIIFCTFSQETSYWSDQSNNSRGSVTDSKYELNVFAIFMFSVKISPLLFKAIFNSPNECLLQNYVLQLFQKKFESRKGFKLSKCSCLDWLLNLTT